jgi:AcrR family transcriptional regulator
LEWQLQIFRSVPYHDPVAATRTDVTPNRRGTRSRETVLDAAERVMAEHGYAGASINAIVKEAGIPISSVYHYFGSKDGVLLAVMERGAHRFFADLPDVDQRVGTPEEHLTTMTNMLVAALEEHPDFLKLVVVMAAQPPAGDAAHAHEVVTRVRDLALGRLRKQLAIAFERDPRNAAIGRLARISLALIDGAFIAHQADHHVKLSTLVQHMPAVLVALEAELSADE